MATTPSDLARLQSALSSIDADTTAIGTAIAAIQARIADLLSQIAASTSPADTKALADQAAAEVGKFDQIVSDLNAMGQPPTPNPAP